MLKWEGVGAYNKSASFSHTHSRCISEFITPTLFSYHFFTLAIGIAFFVFALFTVVGAREEYSNRFHDAELFFLVFTFPHSSFLANFFWIIFTFFQFSCCRRLSSLLFSIVHKRTCNPGYRTPLGCNNQTICTMR